MITQVRFDMSEFKIGDKVVLGPETKPYTFHRHGGGQKEIEVQPNDELDYRITHIYNDGDVDISAIDGSDDTSISPHHLKHAPQDFMELDTNIEPCDNEELRFMIFHSNPSRTLEEMQDMEKWLLNK